jgi:acyl-CoA reductase-like NAD-dependent aldehyde dehydrogenase
VGGSSSANALRRLIKLAGMDVRLFGVLPETTEAGRVAIAARSNKVLFTGSAAVGEKILAQLAPNLTPATMELSGCDAAIVRADADLDLVVKALRFGVTLNNGATCMAPKRVFVSASCATELEGRLAEALRSNTAPQPMGDAMKALLEDALARGAHFIAGGLVGGQSVRLPAVLGGVSPAAKILREDLFAPVLALVTVADDHEAILRANDCPYALTTSIFSRDETAARELAARVNVGVVTINDLIVPTADARLPFGGRNRSGFGSTRGAEGLLALTTPKVVTVTRGKSRPAFETPQPGDAALYQSYLELAHRRGFTARSKALGKLLKSIFNRTKSNSPRKEL